MPTVYFEASSDDRMTATCSGEVLESVPTNGAKHPCFWLLAPSGESLIVSGVYHAAHSHTWVIGVGPTEPSSPIPAWPMSMAMAENGYSPVLSIEVPPETVIQDVSSEMDIDGHAIWAPSRQ